MDDIAIKVEHVSKDFKFSSHRSNTIKSVFTGIFHQKDNESKIQHALKDVSFEIKKGEFFGIVGRNGSGKSTLLKILAGIYQPNKGRVSVQGKLVPFIELGVGFNPELTGRENVYLNGALLGFSEKEVDAFYSEVVEFAELEKFMDKKLKNYSSGMQVRLAFSMAVRAEADVLLVDEVLAVGDADFQRKCFQYFKLLKKNKKTVVFVSHDMTAVREYCDRVILIEDSRLVLESTPDKVASEYTKLFIDKKNNTGTNSGNRWGDGVLEFSKPTISTGVVIDEDKVVVLEVEATAHQTIKSPIFGISVTSPSGVRLLGTNTQLKKIKVSDIDAGKKVHLVWTIPNIFNEGSHYINLAAVYQNGTRTADWWDEAITFNVKREEKNPYPLFPNIEIGIKSL